MSPILFVQKRRRVTVFLPQMQNIFHIFNIKKYSNKKHHVFSGRSGGGRWGWDTLIEHPGRGEYQTLERPMRFTKDVGGYEGRGW
jgi:hypothetical protein